MARLVRIVVCVVAVLGTVSFAADEKDGGALRLTLPPVFYVAPGVEMSIYYDNIVLTETPEAYRFTFKCAVGKSEARR